MGLEGTSNKLTVGFTLKRMLVTTCRVPPQLLRMGTRASVTIVNPHYYRSKCYTSVDRSSRSQKFFVFKFKTMTTMKGFLSCLPLDLPSRILPSLRFRSLRREGCCGGPHWAADHRRGRRTQLWTKGGRHHCSSQHEEERLHSRNTFVRVPYDLPFSTRQFAETVQLVLSHVVTSNLGLDDTERRLPDYDRLTELRLRHRKVYTRLTMTFTPESSNDSNLSRSGSEFFNDMA